MRGTMATLEITTRVGCKNACSYCPQEALVKAYQARGGVPVMSLELFKRCLDQVPKTVRIDFSGMAEPWLNDSCTEMVRYAHRSGFVIAVYTTLVGMGLEAIDLLQGIPFTHFEVHLPDAEGLTKIKVSDDYLAKLGKLMASGISGLGFMTIGTLHPGVAEVIGSRKVHENRVIDRAGNLTGFPGVTQGQALTGIVRCQSCGDRFNHNVLLPNGEVILCCMDYGMRYRLGNLAEDGYEALFRTPTFRDLQRRLNDDRQELLCRYCHNAARSRWNLLPGAAWVRRLVW